MKTMLLLLVALTLSAQTLDKYSSAPIPDAYFTGGRLNGYWWAHASPTQRQIYLAAWQDATGTKISELHYGDNELSLPVVEILFHRGPRSLTCRDLLRDDLDRHSTHN